MPPSSVHSLKSQGSSLQSNRSNCSRKSKGYSYRTIGRQSVVDENLFGDPNRLKEKQKNTNNINSKEEAQINVFRPGISETNCEKERIFRGTRRIKHVASDLIRELIIPEEEPNTKSIILTQDKYNELKEKAHVINDDDERTAIQKAKAAKEAEAAASLARKEEMRKHDLARTKNTKLTDLEEEARKQADVLLQKALEQRQDQEDEIRELNELIRNAKIQAIRDEQILEKQQIRKELSEEELRLDNMMELARQNAIRIQEEIDKKRKEQEMLGACQVLTQIQQNRQDRLLELERSEQENALEQQRISEELLKEIANIEVKRQKQAKIRQELNEANDEMRRRREEERERDRLYDLKILEIQKEKAAREAAYEAEQARIRQEKELEIARLRALQERASDEAAERDALRAKRAAEAREREWRRKEKEEALKKQQTEDELKRARVAQAEERRRLLAIEAGRERAEFERILRRQKEMMDADLREQNQAKLKNRKYAEEVRKQICLKEQERIAERNAFFEEGVKLAEEARLRQMRLMDAKNRKLKELREAGIPEKYLHQVERKTLHLKETESH